MDAPIVSTHVDCQYGCVCEWCYPHSTSLHTFRIAILIILQLFLDFNDLLIFENVKFNPEKRKRKKKNTILLL